MGHSIYTKGDERQRWIASADADALGARLAQLRARRAWLAGPAR